MPDAQDAQTIKDQTFTVTYTASGSVFVGTTIKQPVFPLTEADWAYLKHGEPRSFFYARSFLIGGPMAGIPLLVKVISRLISSDPVPAPILLWEWLAPPIIMGIALLIFIIGAFFNNPSKRVKKVIDNYFDKGR